MSLPFSLTLGSSPNWKNPTWLLGLSLEEAMLCIFYRSVQDLHFTGASLSGTPSVRIGKVSAGPIRTVSCWNPDLIPTKDRVNFPALMTEDSNILFILSDLSESQEMLNPQQKGSWAKTRRDSCFLGGFAL